MLSFFLLHLKYIQRASNESKICWDFMWDHLPLNYKKTRRIQCLYSLFYCLNSNPLPSNLMFDTDRREHLGWRSSNSSITWSQQWDSGAFSGSPAFWKLHRCRWTSVSISQSQQRCARGIIPNLEMFPPTSCWWRFLVVNGAVLSNCLCANELPENVYSFEPETDCSFKEWNLRWKKESFYFTEVGHLQQH